MKKSCLKWTMYRELYSPPYSICLYRVYMSHVPPPQNSLLCMTSIFRYKLPSPEKQHRKQRLRRSSPRPSRLLKNRRMTSINAQNSQKRTYDVNGKKVLLLDLFLFMEKKWSDHFFSPFIHLSSEVLEEENHFHPHSTSVFSLEMASSTSATLATFLWLATFWPYYSVVDGHGRLMNPPSRNAMWRFGWPNPINYNDNEVFCGGFGGKQSCLLFFSCTRRVSAIREKRRQVRRLRRFLGSAGSAGSRNGRIVRKGTHWEEVRGRTGDSIGLISG